MYQNLPTVVFRFPHFPVATIKQSLEDNAFFEKMIHSSAFAEALYFSSPSLYEELVKYKNKAIHNPEKIQRLKISLIKYLSRMSTRCTPFASLAGCATGIISDKTDILIAPEEKKYFRLDMLYLCNLSQQIQKDKILRKSLRYRSNSTIYKIGKRIRYISYSYTSNGRLYKIEELQSTALLSFILKTARKYISFQCLEQKIAAEFESTSDSIETFLHQLIDSQLIISEIDPFAMGPDFFQFMANTLKSSHWHSKLSPILQSLNNLNNDNLPNKILNGENIEKQIQELQIPYIKKFILQTDTIRKTHRASLSTDIISQLSECLQFIHGMMPKHTELPRLTEFKQKFIRRYEEQEIPLLEALDPDIGIGYGQARHSKIQSPLIAGLNLPSSPADTAHSVFSLNLAAKLLKTSRNCKTIMFTDADIPKTQETKSGLPPSCSAMFQLTQDKSTGKIRLFNIAFTGYSAGNLLARFAYCDQTIASLLQDIVLAEQSSNPNAIFAEISHIPDSRIGNILARPLIRDYEISYLNNSIRHENHIINPSDLRISVSNNQLILRSSKLKKRIVPRLTTAHNFNGNVSPLYQFLCDVQEQNCWPGLNFPWNAFPVKIPHYPRVCYKNCILSLEKWTFKSEQLKQCGSDPKLFNDWKKSHNLPRYVNFMEHDNKLFIDLENPKSISVLLNEISRKKEFVLEEFIECENVAVDEHGNSYMNECIIPFIRINDTRQ